MENHEKMYHHEKEWNKESRENKEDELSEELRAAATRERAEFLIKEVKSSTKQVQNLMLHIQLTLSALKALKTQLQLTSQEDPASVVHDKKIVSTLKQKIVEHKTELLEMKEDLVQALMEDDARIPNRNIKTKEDVNQIVERIMHELDIEE